MDMQVVKTITVHFDMDKDELSALRDLVKAGQEYLEKDRGITLGIEQAKVVGQVMLAYEQVRS